MIEKDRKHIRYSIIDGSEENVPTISAPEPSKQLIPIFKEVEVKVVSLEGEETITRKVLVGYKETPST